MWLSLIQLKLYIISPAKCASHFDMRHHDESLKLQFERCDSAQREPTCTVEVIFRRHQTSNSFVLSERDINWDVCWGRIAEAQNRTVAPSEIKRVVDKGYYARCDESV